MTSERNRTRPVPTGRLHRLHRLGAMTSGIAGRLAVDGVRSLSRGETPDLRRLLLTPANARQLADDLARMRGAAMKMGQLLSMEAGDVVPPELAQILARLRAAADPMPPQQLKSVLRDAWGSDWRRGFHSFDTRPIAAASIGQVHRARLRDGRDLAIKVQYPGIADSIDSDVSNLGTLLRVSGLLPRDFDLAPYLAAARAQLRDEADYKREARELDSYAATVGTLDHFVFPEVVPEWSTGSVLSMTYLPSSPIEILEHAPQADRDRAMHRLLALFLDELFAYRTVQTDPNFANYRHCDRTGRIVLLDFGAVRRFDTTLVESVRALLSAGIAGDRVAFEAGADALGLLPAQAQPTYRTAFLTIAEMVLAELRRDSFDFDASDLVTRIREVGRHLASEQVVPPEVPVELLYLQRKAGGMFLLGKRLRARVRIAELLEPHLVASG